MFAVFTTKEIENLNTEEFRFRLKNTKKARLIDVSTSAEHDELHIPGSLNMDVTRPDFMNKVSFFDKTRAYFIYCRDGRRSETACRLMEELGFKKVYHLTAGLRGWKGTLARSY